MKKFLLPLLLLSSPAFADLGPADTRSRSENAPSNVNLKAWCVSKYKDCDVQIDNSTISVNQKNGVEIERVVSWKRTDKFRNRSGFIGPHHLYEYELKYINDEDGLSIAKFVFQNSRSSDSFYAFLKGVSGGKEVRCEYNFEARSINC